MAKLTSNYSLSHQQLEDFKGMSNINIRDAAKHHVLREITKQVMNCFPIDEVEETKLPYEIVGLECRLEIHVFTYSEMYSILKHLKAIEEIANNVDINSELNGIYDIVDNQKPTNGIATS